MALREHRYDLRNVTELRNAWREWMRQMAHSIQDATMRTTDRKKLECRSSHGSEGAPHAICLGPDLAGYQS